MKRKINQRVIKKRTINAEEPKDSPEENSTVKPDPLDDDDQGFGGWLKSTDGLETMKLFVIANSIVMLVTVVYPHLQTAFSIIYDMVYGVDALY